MGPTEDLLKRDISLVERVPFIVHAIEIQSRFLKTKQNEYNNFWATHCPLWRF